MTFDAAGNLLTVAVSEPRFSRADIETLLASRRADAVARGPHGIALDDATDPAQKARWKVPKPRRDFALQKLNAAQAAYRKQYPDGDLGSLLWTVKYDDD